MQTVVCRGRISNFNRKTNTKLLRNHLSLEKKTMAECQDEPTYENVSDEDKTKSCDSCSFRGVGNPADKYCIVCSKLLCISCVEIHGSLKATRTHELVKIEDSTDASGKSKDPITNIMVCDIHWSDLITEFCVTHEKAICPLCKTAKHRKCETKGLREATDERKTSVKDFIDDIKLLSSDFNEIKSSRHRDRNQILETTRRIRINVKKIKEDIIIWAEKLENDTIKEIEKIEKEMVSKIDSHIATTEDMINQLEWVKTSFDKLDLRRYCTEAFVLKAKSEQQIQERRELKQEIQREMNPLTFNFHKSDKLSRLMSEISSFGTIEKEETRFIDFKDISSETKKADIAVDSNKVTGCVFMPSGQLVICDDANHLVKVLTPEFMLENVLKCESRVWDIALLTTDVVVVTKPASMHIDVLNVLGTVRKLKSIAVGEQCWGVEVKKSNIYVSCHLQDRRGGNIKVLTLDGQCVNMLHIDGGRPYYLAVNDTGDRIIVCTDTTSKVLCMDMTGKTIFTYSDSQIDSTLGLLFDSCNNFIVCGRLSNNVHVVKQDGSKHKVLLSSDDGICKPYCLAYNSTDKTLVVGQRATKSLTAFSINI